MSAPLPPYIAPTPKPPFWSRAKVGTVTGLAGLVLGIGVGAVGAETPVTEDTPGVQKLISAEVDQQTAPLAQKAKTLEDESAQLREELAAAEKKAAEARETADKRIADLKTQSTKTTAEAVRKAVAAEKAKGPKTFANTKPAPKPAPASKGDPLFRTCGDANEAGYGNYQQGKDPEYDHYDDRDNDGWVCEF